MDQTTVCLQAGMREKPLIIGSDGPPRAQGDLAWG